MLLKSETHIYLSVDLRRCQFCALAPSRQSETWRACNASLYDNTESIIITWLDRTLGKRRIKIIQTITPKQNLITMTILIIYYNGETVSIKASAQIQAGSKHHELQHHSTDIFSTATKKLHLDCTTAS